MAELLKDARFAHIAKDPKFRRIPKAERKVKIDKRFQGMFKDKKFTVKYTTDKRGRPVNQDTSENLRKYYDLSSSEEKEDASDEDASVLSATEKNKNKGQTKNTKHKKAKSKQKKTISSTTKETKETSSNSIEELSNKKSKKENLLHTKPKEESNQYSDDESDESSHNSEDESVQKEFSQADIDENEKQLHKRDKHENNKLTSQVKKRLKDLNVNYARGEGVLLTDSSSEEESSEDSDDEEEIEHDWGELDKDAETTDEITHRLAICNMNWDMIRAADLMILLNSFLPSGGLLCSVTIYPSEYGQQQMKEEEINGPTELKSSNIDCDDENEDNEEGTKYHMEKLRQYQLNRLKYYYAVAEFDSAETANKVYTECDGIEYESTATRLDLRFIPDDMIFDQEPKDSCDKIPDFTKYQPRRFATTALQQVKVDLTWDDVDPDRQEFMSKVFSKKPEDIDDNELHKYLASGSEDNSDTEDKKDPNIEANSNLDSKVKNDPIEKYKALLRSIEEQEKAEKKDVELEVTWNVDTKEKDDKEKTKINEELTPFQKYVEKRKAKIKAKREEKKQKKKSQLNDSEDSLPSNINMNDKYFSEELKNSKSLSRKKEKRDDEDNSELSNQEEDQRKAELELLLMDQDEDGGKKHFNMKEIEENTAVSKSKRKRLSKKKNVQEVKEDDFEVDVTDPRFTALFTSHHFNIDPADPHYKKTKGTEALVNEKLKRRADDVACIEDGKRSKKPKSSERLSTELQALVKSVKRKTQNVTRPIK